MYTHFNFILRFLILLRFIFYLAQLVVAMVVYFLVQEGLMVVYLPVQEVLSVAHLLVQVEAQELLHHQAWILQAYLHIMPNLIYTLRLLRIKYVFDVYT